MKKAKAADSIGKLVVYADARKVLAEQVQKLEAELEKGLAQIAGQLSKEEAYASVPQSALVEKLRAVLYGKQGKLLKNWTLQREIDWRREINVKLARNKISSMDPFIDVLTMGFTEEPEDFLLSPNLGMARIKGCSPGVSEYTTAGAEKRLKKAGLLRYESDRTPEWRKACCKVLLFGVPVGETERNLKYEDRVADVEPWENPNPELLALLVRSGSLKLVELYKQLRELQKTKKKEGDNYNGCLREQRVKDGTASKRKARAPSYVERSTLKSCDVRQAAPAETELVAGVRQIWELLVMMTTSSNGSYGATNDVLFDIVHRLIESDATVLNCDYAYTVPDGKHYRNLKDRCSFMDENLTDFFNSCGSAANIKVTDERDDVRLGRHYESGVCSVTFYPYAALWDCVKMELAVDFTTLLENYADIFQTVRFVLYTWYQNLRTGGSTAKDVERRLRDSSDEVFGKGINKSLLERPPENLHREDRRFDEVRATLSVRRLRHDEMPLSFDQSGPDCSWPLFREYDFGPIIGRLLWSNGAFFEQSDGKLVRRPNDTNRVVRPLGWMDVDGQPADALEYADLPAAAAGAEPGPFLPLPPFYEDE